MVSERIDDSFDAPAIWLVADRRNHSGSRHDCPFESSVWIFYDHHHSRRGAAQRLRAEAEVFRRLVGQPEFGSRYRQLGDHVSGIVVNAKQLVGPERRLVELNRLRAPSNCDHHSYGGYLIFAPAHVITHRNSPLT